MKHDNLFRLHLDASGHLFTYLRGPNKGFDNGRSPSLPFRNLRNQSEPKTTEFSRNNSAPRALSVSLNHTCSGCADQCPVLCEAGFAQRLSWFFHPRVRNLQASLGTVSIIRIKGSVNCNGGPHDCWGRCIYRADEKTSRRARGPQYSLRVRARYAACACMYTKLQCQVRSVLNADGTTDCGKMSCGLGLY